MARLNKTEKLIQHAAKRLTPIEAKAYDKLIEFYENYKTIYGGNDLTVIHTLYCTDHNSIPFEILAGLLGTSVSRLEKKRKHYQKIFLINLEQLKGQEINVA